VKRSPTFWLIPMIGVCGAIALAAGLWNSGSPPAPMDKGVCWRVDGQGKGVTFSVVAGKVSNFESCAVRLEAIYLRNSQPLIGAYQGRFIFVGPDAIDSAPHLDGSRWPVFFGPQRKQIDDIIRQGRGNSTVRLSPGP